MHSPEASTVDRTTHAYAAQLLRDSINHTPMGERRSALRDSNDPSFTEVRQIESFFATHSLSPEQPLSPLAAEMAHRYEELLAEPTITNQIGSHIGGMVSRAAATVRALFRRKSAPQATVHAQ